MRLPSMNELLSKTGHLSEQSRAIRRLNSPSRNSQISSEEFIDLTSDSPPDSFSLPSLRYYPDTNEPSTSVSSPDYFTFFGMPPTTARRSRESTARREYAVKRRRGNGLDNILTSISPGLTSHTPYQIDSIDFLDLTTPQKDTFNTSSLKRKASEDLVTKHEHDNDFVEAQTVQDKHLSDTIKAQAGVAQAASKLSQLTCIICMDNMENMTATICGK